MRHAIATAIVILLNVTAARSQPNTLERIRHDGMVRCGSAIRPGLAFPAADHSWRGLHVEFCRAIAAAVLGDAAKTEFNGYALRPDYDRIRTGADDVAFLTATELFANELFGAVLPGPTIFQNAVQIMVWNSSAAQHVPELGQTMVCGEPGTPAERELQAYATAHGWAINFSAWMEWEEMMDGFNVGRCPAVLGEATTLAALRFGAEAQGHPTRLLPEPLATTPVFTATPIADPAWAAVVTWTVNTVLSGSRGSIPGEWLGLSKDWQDRVLAAGGYDDLLSRTLGTGSPLELRPGLNASWRDGGTVAAPAVQ